MNVPGARNASNRFIYFFWVDGSNSEHLTRSPGRQFSENMSKYDDFFTFLGAKKYLPPATIPSQRTPSNQPSLGVIDASRPDFGVVWFVRVSSSKRRQNQRLGCLWGRFMHWFLPGHDWFLKEYKFAWIYHWKHEKLENHKFSEFDCSAQSTRNSPWWTPPELIVGSFES